MTELPITTSQPEFTLTHVAGMTYKVVPAEKRAEALEYIQKLNPHSPYYIAREPYICRKQGYVFKDFGLKLQALRFSLGYPKRIVAAMLGYKSTIEVTKLERGLRGATNEQVAKLAAFFKTDCEYWINDDIPIFCDKDGLKKLLKQDKSLILRIDDFQVHQGVMREVRKDWKWK
jgi:transcriptional regulator with XRE-family HTH domain